MPFESWGSGQGRIGYNRHGYNLGYNLGYNQVITCGLFPGFLVFLVFCLSSLYCGQVLGYFFNFSIFSIDSSRLSQAVKTWVFIFSFRSFFALGWPYFFSSFLGPHIVLLYVALHWCTVLSPASAIPLAPFHRGLDEGKR